MSGTILVADDSQIIREMLQMNLQTLGYNVILAEDGERAIERINDHHPDLLIVDVMMPKVNGFQICRRVKSDPATRETPVILLTARAQEEDVFWGKDCGADEYITKPFKTRELEGTVARLLSRRLDQAGGGSSLEREQQRRRDQGGECHVIMLRWNPLAMDIFRKKYGEIRFSEALRALRQAAETFLLERKEPGPVGVHVPFGLSALLVGDTAQAGKSGRDLGARLDALAATFYDPEDRARGHVSFRDPRSGREEHLPLLSFTASIEPGAIH